MSSSSSSATGGRGAPPSAAGDNSSMSMSLEMMDFPMDQTALGAQGPPDQSLLPLTSSTTTTTDTGAASSSAGIVTPTKTSSSGNLGAGSVSSETSSTGGGGFFADQTLDIDIANEIAETPEPQKLMLDKGTISALEMKSGFIGEGGGGGGGTKAASSSNSSATGSDTATPLASNQQEQQSQRQQQHQQQGRSSEVGPVNKPMSQLSHTPQRNPGHVPLPSRSTRGGSGVINTGGGLRPRPPRRPRDIPWLVGFFMFCPLVLLIGTLLRYHDHGSPVALQSAPRRATFWALVFAYAAAVFGLSRLLYRTVGGGEGEDARHVASQVLLAFAPISLAVHPCLMILIYIKTPHAMSYALLPAFFLVRDVWAMRQWRTTASTAGGRQAFFQALVNMALDILSRSLRRSSFYRVILLLLGVQFIVILWWRRAILGCLGHHDSHFILFLMILAAGKWVTGTVARLLGYVASGGVTNWFVQQSLLMEEVEQKKSEARKREQELNGEVSNNTNNGSAGPDDILGDGLTPPATGSSKGSSAVVGRNPNMLEEYRTVDASAYQPVMELDEGIDDDFDDDDDGGGRRSGSGVAGGFAGLFQERGNSTVRGFLFSAMTISFGSIAQCGLLGGLAQFVWSVLRNVEGISAAYQQRFGGNRGGNVGFRGMQIGSSMDDNSGGVILKLLSQAHSMARNFVRTHSDLAMCQVAAYYKSYQRAAQDVAILVDGSGVEPIIHDDITTHMCACVCGSISGVIVIFFGLILDHHHDVRDKTLVQAMLLAFILCYVLLFTVMEPLRASIKAIYVCFAQHPESLSQTFPLIFHRLSRISEANLV